MFNVYVHISLCIYVLSMYSVVDNTGLLECKDLEHGEFGS